MTRSHRFVQAIKTVATEYGIGAETLTNWLKKYRQAHGSHATEPEPNIPDRALLKKFERENQELKPEAVFLNRRPHTSYASHGT